LSVASENNIRVEALNLKVFFLPGIDVNFLVDSGVFVFYLVNNQVVHKLFSKDLHNNLLEKRRVKISSGIIFKFIFRRKEAGLSR
jgi:hypothetical protein